MTAVQDWLQHNPLDPRHLKSALESAWRGLITDKPADVDSPQLMGRGLERC